MATRSQVTEPATPAVEAPETVTEPATPGRTYDPRKRVHVYDTVTGVKEPYPVPETWLDGRFPRLAEVPSTKAGK